MAIIRRIAREPYKPIPSNVIRDLVLAGDPDHISRFKCHVCYYSRIARKHCQWCDGHGIMTRFQYMSFGRSVVPDSLKRACDTAQSMGITVLNRFQSEYDASKAPTQVRDRKLPKRSSGTPIRLFTRRH